MPLLGTNRERTINCSAGNSDIVIRFLDVDCHLIPNIRPNLERRPVLLIGMPVAREILRFAFETPSARFHENDNPGPNFISYEL